MGDISAGSGVAGLMGCALLVLIGAALVGAGVLIGLAC